MNLSEIIEPWGSRIAVRVETKSEFTPGGLYIPVDTARTIHEQRPTQGEIVAMSASLIDEDPEAPIFEGELQIGDFVLFNKHAGHKISYQPPQEEGKPRPEREDIILLSEKDVLARIKVKVDGESLKVKA